MCESVDKADLLSDNFYSKQSSEAVDRPLTCHLSISLTIFVFRLSEVRHLLLNLDPYGGTDQLGMFPLFLMRTADVMGQCTSVVFRQLVSVPAVSQLAVDRPMSSNSKRSTILLC